MIHQGRIAEIGDGRPPEAGTDLGGDFLLPGLWSCTRIISKCISCRARRWNGLRFPPCLRMMHRSSARASPRCSNALRVGNDYDDEKFGARMKKLADAIAAAKGQGLTRAEHFVHLRCEISCADVVDEMQPFLTDPQLKLVSVMDHTPGQRQFTDVSKWKTYYAGKRGASEAEMKSASSAAARSMRSMLMPIAARSSISARAMAYPREP